MRYLLEIYAPNSHDATLGNYSADTPFMPIHVGDLICGELLNSVPDPRRKFYLQATVIEHVITEADGIISHKVCVYTEHLPDDWIPIP